jgi:hypothetical protein
MVIIVSGLFIFVYKSKHKDTNNSSNVECIHSKINTKQFLMDIPLIINVNCATKMLQNCEYSKNRNLFRSPYRDNKLYLSNENKYFKQRFVLEITGKYNNQIYR